MNLLAVPKLTLNAYLGSQFYNNEFRLFQGDSWYGISYVNLALRVPITEAYERSLTKRQLLLENDVVNSKLQVSSSNDSIAVLQKENTLLVLRQKVATQEKIVKLAETNLTIVKAQVDEGTQLVSEYNKELESYLEQQKKRWQAQYDLIQKLAE